MSSGCPARPSGVAAIAPFSKSLHDAGSLRVLRDHQIWVDRIHADLPRAEFLLRAIS
jgi:hypothetical protein